MEMKRRMEEMVYPVPSAHPALHQLSEVDQLMPADMGVPLLLFFKTGGSAWDANVRALQSSLSHALAIFYPLAGRLVQREGAGGRLDVSCLDQGAAFMQAWADCPLSYFGPDFQPHPAFYLLSPLPFSSTPDALLHIQHHILSDGISEFHFIESWVELLNGKTELTLNPYMDLSVLRDGYKLNDSSTPSSKYAQNFLESIPIDFGDHNNLTFITKVFHFTPNFIQSLKEEAKLLHPLTSYECIVAYLWQNVTRACQYSPTEDTRLAYPVDIRKRLNPPLPLGYFGNALLTGFAYAKVGDLEGKPLSYAMSLIRESTSTMTSDYMKLALDWLHKQHSPTLFSIVSQKSLFANSWIPLRMFDLDFPWGKPCCFRTHLPPELAGEYVLILPSALGKGHFDVQVNLQSEHMKRFQNLIMKRCKL